MQRIMSAQAELIPPDSVAVKILSADFLLVLYVERFESTCGQYRYKQIDF
jgi:hypothetical protein